MRTKFAMPVNERICDLVSTIFNIKYTASI